MPIHLPPLSANSTPQSRDFVLGTAPSDRDCTLQASATSTSRRRFLAGSLLAGVSLAFPKLLAAAPAAAQDLFLLLSDVHIPTDPTRAHRSVRSTDGLHQALNDALALATRPHRAIISGDCAFRVGEATDYAALIKLLDPLRKAGVAVDLALGNHDERQHFLDAFPDAKPQAAVVANKIVSVVETTHANWFMLDSLDQTNRTPGLLGQPQLAWLAKALDASPNKPAIVVAHHNPDPLINTIGLLDTAALFRVLEPRKQVKAYVFGHTHRWETAVLDGIHLINIPTTAWVFDLSQPRGFLTAKLQPDRAVVMLHAIDPKHPKNGQTVELKWRA